MSTLLYQFQYSEKVKSRHANKYAFSEKLVCNNCGGKLRRKRWGANGKYKKYVWICVNHANKGNEVCSIKAVDEEKLKSAFVSSINKAIQDKEAFINTMIENINKILESRKEDEELQEINTKLEEIKEQMINLVRLNLRSNLDSNIYEEEYKNLEEAMKLLKQRKATFDDKELIRDKAMKKAEEIGKLLSGREKLLKNFDEELFKQIIEEIRAIPFVEVEFVYKTGLVIKEIL